MIKELNLSGEITLGKFMPIFMPISKLPEFAGNFNEVAEVLQGEVAVTDGAARLPITATWGVGPCVGIAGWDRTNKTSFMCHFDVDKAVRPTQETILYHLRQAANNNQFRGSIIIFSGQSSAEQATAREVIELCRNNQGDDIRFDVVYQELGIQGDGISLALDSRTGALSRYKFTNNKFHREAEAEVTLAEAFIRCSGQSLKLAYSSAFDRRGIKTECARRFYHM